MLEVISSRPCPCFCCALVRVMLNALLDIYTGNKAKHTGSWYISIDPNKGDVVCRKA